MTTPTEAMEAMEEDWEKDTGGEEVGLSLSPSPSLCLSLSL